MGRAALPPVTRPALRPGFTLVELLVVIGVIAILIALLMPTLGRARESANAVYCANNLRQVSMGFRAYADINNGYWPAPWDLSGYWLAPNGGPTYGAYWSYQWPYILSHFVRPDKELSPDDNPIGGNYSNFLVNTPQTAPVMYCPTLLGGGLSFYDQTTYSYVPLTPDENGNYVTWVCTKSTGMRHPADKIHLMDAGGLKEEFPNFNLWANFGGARTDPHAKRSNYLFCDGHVSLLLKTEPQPSQFHGDEP